MLADHLEFEITEKILIAGWLQAEESITVDVTEELDDDQDGKLEVFMPMMLDSARISWEELRPLQMAAP